MTPYKDNPIGHNERWDLTSLPAVGDMVTCRKSKWGAARPKYVFSATVKEVSPDSIAIQSRKGNPVHRDGDSVFHEMADSTWRFFPGRWFAVASWVSGEHWYCDVCVPAKVSPYSIEWLDIEVDVEVFEDGSWWLADVDEFAAAAPAYPSEVIETACDTIRDLVQRSKVDEMPFARTTAGPDPYSAYRHLFKLAAGRRDGIAVVHPDVDQSDPRLNTLLREFASDLTPVTSVSEVFGSAPPTDGLLVVGPSGRRNDVVQMARDVTKKIGGYTRIVLVLLHEATVDPIQHAVDASNTDATAQSPPVVLGKLLSGFDGKTFVATSPEFLAWVVY